MREIESVNKVREYPDGDVPYNTLTVTPHWNDSSKVIFEIDSKSYTFIAEHVTKAMQNCKNSHRY